MMSDAKRLQDCEAAASIARGASLPVVKSVDGRQRAVVDYVGPEVDGGRFPIKRVVGETVTVVAHAFADGHDHVRVEALYRRSADTEWTVREMNHDTNDEWSASFVVTALGRYVYTARAWVDRFETWQSDLRKKFEAGQDVTVELKIGAEMVRDATKGVAVDHVEKVGAWAGALASPSDAGAAVQLALGEEMTRIMRQNPDRSLATTYPLELSVTVDRTKAVYSTWYEVFPRSLGTGGKHGTFADCERMLPEIARMGFDVLYLPPIHPIGQTCRKGKNNVTVAAPDDPGSPWAIGSSAGGHKAIHPELGSLEDFRGLVRKAGEHGLEIAIDIAFQCSPDHPYVTEHPEWFRWRPDGTVQFAENPPKKYQDILPLNFESDKWRELWEELKGIVRFWVNQGVRIFRVDNPHTKPFAFWQWLIEEIQREHPDTLFLAEAFTRPKVMQRLAKVGFSQSYTYFTWRNTKWEIEQYVRELTRTEVGEYMRPSFWPNTPDILPQYLQYGGRAAFIIRLILAATLSSSYGIYGPAFELGVSEGIEGKEEYLNSEKYEIKDWDWSAKNSIRAVIERVNRIRRQNPSLQSIRNVEMYPADNEMILCYGKMTEDGSNMTVTVVNIDPRHKQSGRVHVPLRELGIDSRQPFLMHDLITDDKHIWQGETNYVELDPCVMPGHILRVQKRMRREMDFDYFM
ncbi:MAG: alpha-1,4-glucan--maltose-1-phosphate maltosyltransferase [Sedimentisphaerales bacterium]|nr:alpha-1,4-glucan--maltose-1-phosphate maltosyltransferase [Sedimentisphaerales bacterium]